MNDEYCLAIFKSTHDALSFEKRFLSEGYKITIMPVPRKIKNSCGLSIRFSAIDLDNIVKIINKENISFESIYLINNYKMERIIKNSK